MNDVATTEKPETAAKKSVQRYYVTPAGKLISRRSGLDTEIVDLDAPLLRRNALIAEGIIRLLNQNETIEDILSGEAIPDRTLPPSVTTPSAAKSLSKLLSAIVAHKAKMLKDVIGEDGRKMSHAEAKSRGTLGGK